MDCSSQSDEKGFAMLVVKLGGSVGVVSFMELTRSRQILVLQRTEIVPPKGDASGSARVGLVGVGSVKFLRYGTSEQPWEKHVEAMTTAGWTVVDNPVEVQEVVDRMLAAA